MAFTYRDMGRAFHEYIFRNGWMDCRDTFHAVLCSNATKLSMKQTGLSVF